MGGFRGASLIEPYAQASEKAETGIAARAAQFIDLAITEIRNTDG